MRGARNERWDEAVDRALRVAAAEVRANEHAPADTDEAWTTFIRERQAVPSRRAARLRGRLRTLVPIVSFGLVMATILTLVWLSGRPVVKQPIDVNTTTVTTPTSTSTSTSTTDATSTTEATATTQAAPLASSSALTLPTFPDGKQIESLAAVSDAEWFALSNVGPEGRQSYPKLWHTTDAGATWVDLLLPTGIGDGQVHFADPLNGWMIASQVSGILTTHDGGITWAHVDVSPRGEFVQWPAVAISGGRVHVLGDVPIDGNSRIGVMSSPVKRDEFVWSGDTMGDVRWGLTPNSSQLVIRGASGWAISYGVTTPPPSTPPSGAWPPGALRLIDGTWKAWVPPCAETPQGGQLTSIRVPRLLLGASSSGRNLTVVCEATTEGSRLRTFVSEDQGATFVEGAPMPEGVRMTDRSWIQVLDDGTALVGAALGTGELVVERSDDGGTSWAVDTSFGGVGDFATMTVTPTGRMVVVASLEGTDGARREVVRSRDSSGVWFRLGTE